MSITDDRAGGEPSLVQLPIRCPLCRHIGRCRRTAAAEARPAYQPLLTSARAPLGAGGSGAHAHPGEFCPQRQQMAGPHVRQSDRAIADEQEAGARIQALPSIRAPALVNSRGSACGSAGNLRVLSARRKPKAATAPSALAKAAQTPSCPPRRRCCGATCRPAHE